ncbi:hypothetical protein DY000_02002550, partial [Brassica cretica]
MRATQTDIMRDPHVAADGFTYEAKNIRYWLNLGNNTSPQTGARLAHRDLTPNYTLRSLIMDCSTTQIININKFKCRLY